MNAFFNFAFFPFFTCFTPQHWPSSHTSMFHAVTAKGSQGSRNSKGKTPLPPDRSAFDTLWARIFIQQFANLTQHGSDSAVFQEKHGLWCTFFILSSYALRINALSVC